MVILLVYIIEVTVDALNAEVQGILGEGVEPPEELEAAVGEMWVFHNHDHRGAC